MKNISIFFVALFLTFSLSAQAWNPLQPAATATYGFNEFCAVDSSWTTGQDSIFRLYPIAVLDSIYAYPGQPNWFGKTVVKRPNTEFIYLNHSGDSLHIFPEASLSSPWSFYTASSGAYIELTIDSLYQSLIPGIGLMDSLKRMTFHAFDSLGGSVVNSLNGKSLLLSRNYGFVHIGRFGNFPDSLSGATDQLRFDTLMGWERGAQRLGVTNLTPARAGDFSQGDLLHILERSPNNGYHDSIQSINKILQVLVSTPTLKSYQVERWQLFSNWDFNFTGILHTYKHDTVTWTYNDNLDPEWKILPGDTVVNNGTPYGNDCFQMYHHREGPDGLLTKETQPVDWRLFCDHTPSIADGYHESGVFQNRYYIEGLGGPFYLEYEDRPHWDYEKSPVYFKKGNRQWGTPYDSTYFASFGPQLSWTYQVVPAPADTVPATLSMNLVPNPGDQESMLRLELPGPGNGTVEVYDVIGRKVASTEVSSDQRGHQQLPLSPWRLRKGMYVFSLEFEGQIIRQKYLIQIR